MSEFLDALNSTLDVNVGDLVQGEVILLQDNKQVIVGILNAGVEGVIPARELSANPVEYLEDVVSVGDVLDLVVVSTISDKENGGSYLLSKRRVDSRKVWSELEEKYKNGESVEGTVVDVVRGGLIVDLGVRAFVPASLVSDHFIKNLSSFKGKTYTFKIINCDSSKRSLILSRKELVEAEKAEKLKQALSKLAVDDIVSGVVARLTKFGAFIDLGGVDGLVHISELAHQHIKAVEEVLSVGQEVNVKILDIDEETGRVSLSIKATQKTPWELVAETFVQGDTVKGIVRRLVDFGAFVEILPGVEGLVHVSQISHERVSLPHEVLSVGQEVDVQIQEFRVNDQRVSLSMKALIEKSVEEFKVSEENSSEDYDVSSENITVTLGDILSEKLQ